MTWPALAPNVEREIADPAVVPHTNGGGVVRTGLVILHAAPGVIGLLTGLFSLSPPRPGDGRSSWRRGYVACIAVLAAGLVALIVYDWGDLDSVARAVFTGLAGLAAFMGFRLWRARREASVRREGWQSRYVAHIYFSYVALWIGFLIVPALNSPAPQIAIPLVIVVVLAIGHVLIARYRRHLPDRAAVGAE